MQKTNLQLYLLLVIITSLQAHSLRAQAASVPNATFQSYADSLIAAMSTEYKIPGCAVAITDHGKVVYQSTYGYVNVEKKLPVAPDSRFRLGSVTKMFTAMAIMQLVEQGKVDLEAPVEQYIPDLKIKQLKAGNPVRIRHLLTHTSGFTDDIFNYSYGGQAPPQQTLVALANEEVLSIEPGYIFNYSNVGYGLLGVVIERISGLTYAEYTERYLFRPLGLRATAAYYNVPTDEKVALGYNAKGTRVDEPLIRDIAAGGALSTIEDLVMLQQVLANPETLEQTGVLRRATFDMMCTPQTNNLTLATDEKFGLGLFIIPLGIKDDRLIGDAVGHGGDFSFHHAITMAFPKAQLGISIACNGAQGDAFYQKLYHRLLRKYYAVSRNAEGAKSNPDNTFSALGLQNERIDHREINGIYGGGGSGYIRLKRVNEQKIRFQQGKNVLMLKRNDATNRYHVRYKLLRLIPIKVKNMEFAFLKVDDRIVLKACYPGSGDFEYISRKDMASEVPKDWINRAGTYEIVDPFPGNVSVVPERLTIVQQKLVMHRHYLLTGEKDEIGFDIINEKTAVSDGIDRGCAATLKVLPNGNLYYSGYEMRLIGPK
jgi:CubicO group peptidase (beta-lactamase class C family)